MKLEQIAIIVDDYDTAIDFFVDVLGFDLIEDFEATYERLRNKGVEFVRPPKSEPYGRFAVFTDVAGNRWDLLGPRTTG